MRSPSRSGSVNTAWLAGLSLLVLAGLVGLLLWNSNDRDVAGNEPVFVYCAAAMREPVAAAAREYEQTYGVPVQVQYAPSQTLLSNCEISRKGDLYLPADDSYFTPARAKNLIDEVLPLASMAPVLAVAKGNPKKIQSLDDLQRADVRLTMAEPDAAAVSKVVRDALRKTGQWDKVKEHSTNQTTVTEVANALKVGSADAGFVWDSTLKAYPELEAVPLPQLKGITSRIGAAVLRSTTQPAAALRFARFLSARDRGLKQFEKAGFQVIEGDVWAEKPEVKLFAGAMLHPAIEKTIEAFEQREGARVTRVYNGCGILVSQMKTGARPDAYFACDKSFMSMVSDLFLDATDVSTNELVILVPKGNPNNIKGLEDLAKPNVRVGVGDEHKCALGALTQITLREGGVRKPIMDKEPIQRPTGDMLVNDLRVKAIDAAIAYISNAAEAGDEFDVIKVDMPCAIAVQPLAVGKESPNRQLAGRLMDALRSQKSRDDFEKAGFHWKDGKK